MPQLRELVLVLMMILAYAAYGNEDFLVKIKPDSSDKSISGLIIHESGVIVSAGSLGLRGKTALVELNNGQSIKAREAIFDSDNEISFYVMEQNAAVWLDLGRSSAAAVTGETYRFKTGINCPECQQEAVCLSYFKNGNIRLSFSDKPLLDGSCAFNNSGELTGIAFNRAVRDKNTGVLIPAVKIMDSYRRHLPDILKLAQENQQEKVILKLQGSNTIGAQLADSLSVAYLKKIGCKNISLRQGSCAEEKKIRGYYEGRLVSVEIKAHGSTTAFSGLKSNECDIGMASRPVKSKEAEELSALGNMTSYQNEHVLALDGIAIVVNQSNPLNKLSVSQLAALFSGEIKDWSEITPYFSGPVKILSRDDKSGTFDSFKSLVLGSTKPEKKLAGSAEKIESSVELADKVARDANAIGFIGLPYIRDCKPLEISQEISTEEETAFFPSVFSVATEDYALSRRLFLYTPEKSSNPHCRSFVEFALSESGQQIVEDCGFVSQNITLEKPQLPPNSTPRYSSAVKNSNRLSLNFRFKPGSFELDNKSYRDLSRVVSFLKNKRNKEILLLGFADNTGSVQANYQLSQKRAETVNNQLKKWGIRPGSILGMGSEVPIASNSTEDGRQKNRRVEILLRD